MALRPLTPTTNTKLPEEQSYAQNTKIILSADKIAERASRGEDVSAYFTSKFTVVKPVHRVSVDLTPGMLRKLDERPARLNVSRQAMIKTLLDRALEDSHRKTGDQRKAG